MSRSGAEIIASENRSKYIQSRISRVEHDFGQLCATFTSYTHKTAHLRDKGDKMCSVLRQYADTELINASTKNCLCQFTEYLSGIQDYRQAQVNRLEANVLKPMCAYGAICKDAKTDIRCALTALEKEQKSVKYLQKSALKFPNNDNLLYRARADVDQATLLSIRTSKDLHAKMDLFEKKKLEDLKKVLVDFVKIEMMFHAKALEVYTKCFHAVNKINPLTDFMEFRRYFFDGDPRVTPDVKRASLASMYSTARMVSDDATSTLTSQYTMPQSVNTFYPDPHNPTLVSTIPSLPYSLVNTNGIPHYKMNEMANSAQQKSVSEPNESDANSDDDDDGDDDENDDDNYDETTTEVSTPRKKVTMNSLVDVVDLDQTI